MLILISFQLTVLQQQKMIRDDLKGQAVRRLRNPKYIKYWRDTIKAPQQIIQVLTDGFQLEFSVPPRKQVVRNNQSALKNPTFVSYSIQTMAKLGIVSEVDSQKIHCVSPLSLVDTGKVRLVLDLSRTVNPVSQYKKISLGALQDFNRAIQPEDYMGIAEITNAYYHVPVKEAYRKYLGFRWEYPDKETRHYVFNVLVSGSNGAVAFLHSLLVPIVAYCNSHGVPVVGHIDEFPCHVSGVRRLQRRVSQTLACAVRGREVLEHTQTLAEVRADRRLDDLARRLRHQATHASELTDLLDRATRLALHHAEDRVDIAGLIVHVLTKDLHELLAHLITCVCPEVDDLQVALTLGDDTLHE